MYKRCLMCRHLDEEDTCTNPRFTMCQSAIFKIIDNSKLREELLEAVESNIPDKWLAERVVSQMFDTTMQVIYEELGKTTETLILEPDTFWCADYESSSL